LFSRLSGWPERKLPGLLGGAGNDGHPDLAGLLRGGQVARQRYRVQALLQRGDAQRAVAARCLGPVQRQVGQVDQRIGESAPVPIF